MEQTKTKPMAPSQAQSVQKSRAPRRIDPNSFGYRAKTPLVIAGVVVAVAAASYLALCTYAAKGGNIWRNTHVLGQNLGGMSIEEAAQTLDSTLPNLEVDLYLYDREKSGEINRAEEPDATIALKDLDIQLKSKEIAEEARTKTDGSFLSAGWRYLTYQGDSSGANAEKVVVDPEAASSQAQSTANSLSWESVSTQYALNGDTLSVTTAQDGRQVDVEALRNQLMTLQWAKDLTLDVPYTIRKGEQFTAQEIHDKLASEMKNAGFDQETQSIIPEKVGAEFDIPTVQRLIDETAPGDTMETQITIKYPTVTAENLKDVLFRDVLGECTTRVGGSSGRRSNVRLSASAIDGKVLNSGDIFSYNDTVGQRTAAKGYAAAPAYVQGQTVNEIGGGVCQTSSTLYLACLRSNLEITERYAHRYESTYMPAGMDATVSWGGPDYRFTNNTDYPIKITTSYSGGSLTVRVLGTNVDGTSVKMTNKTVSYDGKGGKTVKTYRNVYDASGNLISDDYEATSVYHSHSSAGTSSANANSARTTTTSGTAEIADNSTRSSTTKPTTSTAQNSNSTSQNTGTSNSNSSTSKPQSSSTPAPEPEPEPAPEPTSEPAPAPEPEPEPVPEPIPEPTPAPDPEPAPAPVSEPDGSFQIVDAPSES